MTTEQNATGDDGRLPTLERRNLRLLLVAQTTSTGGTQITAVALPLLLVQSFHAPAFVLGLFAAARYIPFIVLGAPVGGFLDNRDDPHRTMLMADGARLLALAAIPVLWLLDALTLPVLLILVLIVAAFRVLYDLSSALFIVRGFDRRSWLTANSRIDSLFSATESLGPTAAGAISSAVGAVWALVLDVVSYAISFVCVRRLRLPADRQPVSERSPQPRPTRTAARFLFTHPVLRIIVVVASLQNAALMTLQGVVLLILLRVHDLPAYLAGAVMAGLGIGGAAAAYAAPGLIGRFGLSTVAAAAVLVTPIAPLVLLVPSRGPGWLIYFFAYLLLGAGIALGAVTIRRYRQEVVPAESFARVQGIYSVVLMGSLPVGALLGGMLAQWVAPWAAAVGASTLFAASAGLMLAARRGESRMEMKI